MITDSGITTFFAGLSGVLLILLIGSGLIIYMDHHNSTLMIEQIRRHEFAKGVICGAAAAYILGEKAETRTILLKADSIAVEVTNDIPKFQF